MHLILILVAMLLAAPAQAQTPPTEAERNGYGGLHAAAVRGDVAEIRRLIAAGANPNARDGAQRTPVHVAAYFSRIEAMQALVAGGGDINALEHRKYDVVTIASVKDDEATLKAALALNANARAITSPYDGTALIAAAHLGHDGVVRQLIRAGAPLDHVNNLGWTALIEAVILGDGGRRHQETVRALVEAGARLDLADREGRTPLQHARSRGYADIARIIESKSAR
ncbi:MAG TPA: ankyrin repeat domain-containing protein [Beijerinckiaceae bacterium]|nr:ankyrin repeat domain-containing protein [Beijerinckiaceae bacterium]